MRRWHQERDLMLRRWRIEIAKHERGYSHMALAPVPPQDCDEPCHCYRGPGFLRKRRPLDCGRPRCGVCHFEKIYGRQARANEGRQAIEFDLAAAG